MDGYKKILLPQAPPTAAGEIGMSGSGAPYTLQFHNGLAVQDLPGAGSGSTANPIVQLEQDLGGPARSGRFTITDASFLAGHQLYIQMAADAISTKGTRTDENEMDNIDLRGAVTAEGTAIVYWSSATFVKGRFRFNYRSS